MSSPEIKTQILVVEDEGIVAKDLQAMLRRLGYHVPVTVGSGDRAIEMAALNKPDLILMDIQIRGDLDGVQTAAAITAKQDVAIVYLTANSDSATLQRAKLTDPFGFLIKPFEQRALNATIETALYKHRTEQKIREREQWLHTTLSSIADAVITTDTEGRVTFINAAAEQLTGWLGDEALNRPYQEIFHVVDELSRIAPEDYVVEAIAGLNTGSIGSKMLLLTHHATEVHIEHSVAPIRQGSGERVSGCVIVFSDVSEKRQLEEKLRQAQKMDAIGKLAGGIAHDFNNAITAIIGYAEMILSKSVGNDVFHREAKQIVRAAEHSARLTHQLLAFSRKQVLQPRSLDLTREVGDIEGMVRRLIGATIKLTTRMESGLWSTMADAGQIQQVLLNMAINARDAMPNGGELTFELSNTRVTAEEALHLQEGRPGEFILLRIRDDGMGMEREVLRQIFEPFFTTKGPGKGTGLGLATCYGIVKQSAGMLSVESEVGVGTVFSIYLPKAGESLGGAEIVEDIGLPRGTETILVVEDEEILRELAVEVLTSLGYKVVAAEDGTAAMEWLAADNAPHVDLVATDLVMPRMSGRELVTWINGRFGELRVLLMSGYTDDEIIKSAVEGAEMQYIQKPFTPRGLAHKIRRILDGPPRRLTEAA